MGGIFSKPKINVPEPQPPAPMPDPEDPSIRERKRRTAMDMLTRAGRRSTILGGAGSSQSGQGGSAYAGRALG